MNIKIQLLFLNICFTAICFVLFYFISSILFFIWEGGFLQHLWINTYSIESKLQVKSLFFSQNLFFYNYLCIA